MKDSINRVPTKTLATKKCGEDDGLMSGLEVVEQMPEKEGTNSLRAQEENDWQPASETDLRNHLQDTLQCCNLKPGIDESEEDQTRSKPRYWRPSYGLDLRCDRVLHLVV